MKIALIGGRSGEVLYKELIKRGYETYLIAGKSEDSGVKIADKKKIIDLRKKDEILEYLKENNIKEIILGTGHIYALNLVKFLKENLINCAINLEAANLCKDKTKLKLKLEEWGYKTPKYILKQKNEEIPLEILENVIGYPIVIKSPVDDFMPCAIYTKKKLKSKLLEIKNKLILFEKCIIGNEISVPITNDLEDVRVLGIMNYSKGKDEKLEGFENMETINLNREMEKKIVLEFKKLIEKINATGLVRVDSIVEREEIYILEINSIIVTGETNDDYTKIWKEKKMDFPSNLINAQINILNKLRKKSEK